MSAMPTAHCTWCGAEKPARRVALTDAGWRQAGYVWTDRGWRKREPTS